MIRKFKVKSLKLKVFLIVLGAVFLLGNLVWAHTEGIFWKPGEPLVPCGGPSQSACTQCELLHLTRHLVDFILVAAAPILATFFFIVAGVCIMLGGANPGMLATGKRMFKDTFIGILIVMMAWLITNTLIQSLVDVSKQKVGYKGSWWQVTCSQIGLRDVPGSGGGGGGGGGGGCTDPVCVSGEQAVDRTRIGATITWTTNVPATSQVHYGASPSTMFSYTPINGVLTISHIIVLTGLAPGRVYYYEVLSARSGYTAAGSIQQFTTLP